MTKPLHIRQADAIAAAREEFKAIYRLCADDAPINIELRLRLKEAVSRGLIALAIAESPNVKRA